MGEILNKLFCKEIQEENKHLKEKVEVLETKIQKGQETVNKTNAFYKGILKKNNIQHP